MSLSSSLSAFRQIFREDLQLARFGPRRGSLLRMHYWGRWEARRGREAKTEKIQFQHFSKWVDLELSAPYLGAFKGIFLDIEYDCTHVLVTHPRRILDLGANIGMAAISLTCQFPESEVICVEPDSRNLPLLETNLRMNNVKATVIPAAIGANPGSLKLRFDSDPTCSALETSPMHNLGNTTPVKVVTVTDILTEAGWDSVDLVKIDIEGTEEELLSLNNEWLARVHAVILEIHPNTTPEKISSYLAPYGFHLSRFGRGSEPVYFGSRK